MQLFIALALTVVAAHIRVDDPGPATVNEETPAVPYIHIEGPGIDDAPAALPEEIPVRPYVHVDGPADSYASAALPQ